MKRLPHFYALLLAVLACCLFAAPGFAFLKPEDVAGPLTVQIEGPAEISSVNTPVEYAAVIVNSGGDAVDGALRIAVIDDWRAEPASSAFHVDANATTRIPFTVTAGPMTVSALYPIHVYAEFKAGETAFTAHPIAIVTTKLASAPASMGKNVWSPASLPAGGALALGWQPVFRVVTAEFGKPAETMPVAWQGVHDGNRGSAQLNQAVTRGSERHALAMHPCWFGGRIGSIWTEFPVQLPDSGPITLRFGTAIRDNDAAHNEPPSDGVTFRVRVAPFDAPEGEAGQVLFERHSAAKQWEDSEVDLSAFAGQAVRIQLECHPGPKNDSTCDQAYWAEPILLAGVPATAATAEPRVLTEGVLRLAGEEHTFSVSLGSAGLLNGAVEFKGPRGELGINGFVARAAGSPLGADASACILRNVSIETGPHGPQVRHAFSSPLGSFDLLAEVWAEGAGLRIRFWLENTPEPKPWQVAYLEKVALGPWSRDVHRLYAGVGNVIEKPEACMLHFDGHQLSTSFVGLDFVDAPSLVQAVDVPPTMFRAAPAEHVASLETPHALTWTLIPTSNVWEGVKAWRGLNGLKAAGGVQRAAGRFVFDLWGGHYASSAAALEHAFAYGLTDSMVVWHNWQRWGYDYRLPDICPPNPELGTVDEFRSLIDTCVKRDVVFAPHDNYIDFYPDADDYSYDLVAFHGDGKPFKAWLNEGRGAQAYRWRVDQLRPYLERNLGIIKRDYKPTGYFIDVWSSAGPHDFWTREGRFFDRVYTRQVWGESFAWIREQLGGNAPQISESGHDQLIGWLDGAQTNHLRVDANPPADAGWMIWPIRCADAERVPWSDMAHHDRFALHGAGYGSRYAAGLDSRLHGIYSDDYMTSEVLAGHPAMVSSPFGRDVVRKYWLLHDVMRGLALQTIESVEFAGDDIHRQHVSWANGARVSVNRGAEDWDVEGHTLPQYGFYAHVPVEGGAAEAAIERRNGVIVEWATSPEAVYCNARPVIEAVAPVSVNAEAPTVSSSNTIDIPLHWQADRPFGESLRVFVHLIDGNGKIRMQGDYDPTPPTTEWQGTIDATAHVPLRDDVAMGQSFALHVGFYHAGSGARVPFRAGRGGDHSAILGTMTLNGENGQVRSLAWKPEPAQADPYLERFNVEGKAVDFGSIATNGACRISMGENAALLVTPLPESPLFNVEIETNALPWTLPSYTRMESLASPETVSNSSSLTTGSTPITLQCEAGVFAYRYMTQ
ncbi:MAG: hypothetical protein IT364_17955 [Candidatus Hydrogenedentes bacterium]|nr:hypothetical protein [Candidatus Hydrogenedentota bacterium]